jgi:hypothetical protein
VTQIMQTATISIDPCEGFFDRLGIVSTTRPNAFSVEVGSYGPIGEDPRSEAWVGKVIDGYSDWLGLKVILRQKLCNYNDAVVAYIIDGSENEIFSGTCETNGLV